MKDATLENPLVAGGKQLPSGGCGKAEGNRRRNFCQEKSSLFCDRCPYQEMVNQHPAIYGYTLCTYVSILKVLED
jgi:hypothetical protein